MSIIDDVVQGQDAFGKEVQAKRAIKHQQEEAAENAKSKAKKEQEQHEENKRQGMI
jgi:hypothetical protein